MDYEKLLIKAKEAYNKCATNAEKRRLETIFPELTESENEQILKEIGKYLYNQRHNIEQPTPRTNEFDKWIAWLEKQGEHAKFRNNIQIGDNVTRNQAGMLVNLSQLERVAKPREKQGEQKQVEENKGNVGKISSAWSEEDEKGFSDALWAIKQARTIAKNENDMGNLWFAERWLKSIKNRVQLK